MTMPQQIKIRWKEAQNQNRKKQKLNAECVESGACSIFNLIHHSTHLFNYSYDYMAYNSIIRILHYVQPPIWLSSHMNNWGRYHTCLFSAFEFSVLFVKSDKKRTWAMIRSKDLITNLVVTNVIHHSLRRHKVIQPPSDIFCSGSHHVGPKGVFFLHVRIKVTESIDKAFTQQRVKA